MKNEFLMLAQTLKNQFIGGWYASEKLNGCRAFWDGGISRGMRASKVPYTNCVKDHRLNVPPVATGLWSRTGKVVHAPDWWLDQLPKMLLDGELYLGKHRFQELRTIIGKHVPENWDEVQYRVFDSPSWYAFGRPREVKIRGEYTFKIDNVPLFVRQHATNRQIERSEKLPFDIIQKYLHSRCKGLCVPIKQILLPWIHAREAVDKMLNDLVLQGAEGVILRKPSCVWIPERSKELLKYKPFNDAEGTVTGFTSGKGKYSGMIGALILDFNGKRLELSGMTDEERRFHRNSVDYAAWKPGEDMPPGVYAKHFEVGDIVTFKYGELSDDGVPKEARYWRQK